VSSHCVAFLHRRGKIHEADPSVKRIAALGAGASAADEAPSWKLILNAPVEIDA
jgi:hypothetical protein